MRSDLLSKRIFLAGCFGLPWLWIVHILYSKDLESSGGDEDSVTDNSNQGLLDADEHFPEEPTNMTPHQIAEARKSWVAKCKGGAITAVVAWAAWIVVAQVLKNDLPTILYVRSPDDGEWTGW